MLLLSPKRPTGRLYSTQLNRPLSGAFSSIGRLAPPHPPMVSLTATHVTPALVLAVRLSPPVKYDPPNVEKLRESPASTPTNPPGVPGLGGGVNFMTAVSDRVPAWRIGLPPTRTSIAPGLVRVKVTEPSAFG